MQMITILVALSIHVVTLCEVAVKRDKGLHFVATIAQQTNFAELMKYLCCRCKLGQMRLRRRNI